MFKIKLNRTTEIYKVYKNDDKKTYIDIDAKKIDTEGFFKDVETIKVNIFKFHNPKTPHVLAMIGLNLMTFNNESFMQLNDLKLIIKDNKLNIFEPQRSYQSK